MTFPHLGGMLYSAELPDQNNKNFKNQYSTNDLSALMRNAIFSFANAPFYKRRQR